MNSKDRLGIKKSIISRIIALVLVINIALFAGMASGGIAGKYVMNSEIGKINTDIYKSIISSSLPVFSPDKSAAAPAASEGIWGMLKDFFTVDLYNPACVLSAEASDLYDYYLLVSRKAASSEEVAENSIGSLENTGEPEETLVNTPFYDDTEGSVPSQEELIAERSTIGAEAAYTDLSSRGLREDASSISTDKNAEKEGPPAGKFESNGKIVIRNETKYAVDINELVKKPLKLDFNKKNNKILIYHTHTTESYIQKISQLNSLTATRSRDPKLSVVRVGEELAEVLRKSFKLNVIHNTTVHDYPDFNKSYVNSLKTVTALLKEDPGIKIIIDLHRDAAGGNQKLREVVDVNGKKAAKIMFVVSTGEVLQNHPAWKENFRLALALQENLMEQSPQLTQPVFLSKNTFNQHVSNGALLIEIGGDGNLMEECLESAKYLAKAINAVVNK